MNLADPRLLSTNFLIIFTLFHEVHCSRMSTIGGPVTFHKLYNRPKAQATIGLVGVVYQY